MWENLPNCRQTKIFTPMVGTAKAVAIRSLDRFQAGRLVQFLTGHVALNRHLSVMGIADLQLCRLCQEEDDEEAPDHLLNRCPALENERRNILTATNTIKRVKQISDFISLQKITALFNYQLDDDRDDV